MRSVVIISVSALQLVSRHVIEIQEIGFTELRRVVGLHQILAGSVITCLEPLLNSQCRFKFWGYTKYSSLA